ncbi:MAG: carboxypeptidase regulatory-like domain-containing protein, partial [Acidobacteria bacterium]|nr:carboxypeptidase regulatory-like domain-containing protein [Acidobacteriota bacterium]
MSKRIFSLAVIFLAAIPAMAQSHRASVRGVVVDPTGAPVHQVTLRITSETTGESRATVTRADGRFAVAMLPPGAYRIEVELAGYKKYVSRTELQINQELWLHVPLALGEVTEEIVVTAPLVPLETESAALGTVIDGRQLAGLPLDGRNFLELSLLV